nr:putative glycerol kinase 5 isoform X1 [Ciona intestinalis]|eukprot:XP_002122427.1 putative glycerol kinase 5 isoform X1 [Ciona intestinalis]
MDLKDKYVLSLDIGTSNMRCFIYDKQTKIKGRSQCRIKILYPEPQAVEMDPDELWEQILGVMKEAIQSASITPDKIASIGISTQRGTFMLWDKETGKPFHNFLVWQDTRGDALSKSWNDSYTMKFLRPASKGLHLLTQRKKFLAAAVLKFRTQHVSIRLLWLFNQYPDLKGLAREGKVRFGTLDTWVVWKLSGGKVYTSEYSCASSTGIYDPYILDWSGFFCSVLNIPKEIFPPVIDTYDDYGVCEKDLFGFKIPIRAVVGDQQAAMFGQCCFEPGDVKLTLGTGAFLDLNVGNKPHTSVAGFYPIVGWKIGDKVVHLAEGSSNTAGDAVDWMKGMNFIKEPCDSDDIANLVDTSEGVYFVPAFNGIQAPINDYLACGGMMGITQNTKAPHIVRAVLESLAFRNKQVFDSMVAETSLKIKRFVCDGGVCANKLIMQLTADLVGQIINRQEHSEMSALGAAYLAGLAVGYWKNMEELKSLPKQVKSFTPNEENAKKYSPIMKNWCRAAKRSLNWYSDT